MEYKGKLYGRVNKKYFDTGRTADDWDALEKRVAELEEAGNEATSLIAHLKDQYGFNEVEEDSQDKIMAVFDYEGRW